MLSFLLATLDTHTHLPVDAGVEQHSCVCGQLRQMNHLGLLLRSVTLVHPHVRQSATGRRVTCSTAEPDLGRALVKDNHMVLPFHGHSKLSPDEALDIPSQDTDSV